jgi:hypothetical protein
MGTDSSARGKGPKRRWPARVYIWTDRMHGPYSSLTEAYALAGQRRDLPGKKHSPVRRRDQRDVADARLGREALAAAGSESWDEFKRTRRL